jgi:hypothetical protein
MGIDATAYIQRGASLEHATRSAFLLGWESQLCARISQARAKSKGLRARSKEPREKSGSPFALSVGPLFAPGSLPLALCSLPFAPFQVEVWICSSRAQLFSPNVGDKILIIP